MEAFPHLRQLHRQRVRCDLQRLFPLMFYCSSTRQQGGILLPFTSSSLLPVKVLHQIHLSMLIFKAETTLSFKAPPFPIEEL